MMFQNYALFPHLSVRDNVAFSLKMKGVDAPPTAMQERGEMLELVDMTELADRMPDAAVRRAAAARGAGARADHRAAGAAARRAAVGARPVPAHPDARPS
jgi:ABC-type Fe3+/spermidine/putrescine transport system ATPase subunit